MIAISSVGALGEEPKVENIDKYDDILDLLRCNNVLYVHPSARAGFKELVNLKDGCDGYYNVELDREALERLIYELRVIAEKMQ